MRDFNIKTQNAQNLISINFGVNFIIEIGNLEVAKNLLYFIPQWLHKLWPPQCQPKYSTNRTMFEKGELKCPKTNFCPKNDWGHNLCYYWVVKSNELLKYTLILRFNAHGFKILDTRKTLYHLPRFFVEMWNVWNSS